MKIVKGKVSPIYRIKVHRTCARQHVTPEALNPK